jgi:hypothetical protein
VCAPQRDAGIAEQASEDCSAAGEREVRHDSERFLRPFVLGGVALDDLHSLDLAVACAKLSCQGRIELDDHDLCSCSGECLREDATTPADLDHQVAARDLDLEDEVGCEPLTSDEVLTGRTPRGLSPDGHGTSPSSSHQNPRASDPAGHRSRTCAGRSRRRSEGEPGVRL